MPDKKRILFVDDEPNILAGLRRMLRPMRRQWDMKFAESGQEALKILEQTPCSVVVTDMRMPGMNGAQLLREVMKRHPKTVRIVLSGQSDRDSILDAIGPIHQYLSKPCDAETLKSTLVRACTLDNHLADEELKQHISQMETLPSSPTLYNEVVGELQSPNASALELGQIISKDMGMSAKVLQLVSSAFFGLRPHIPHPAQAVILLGMDTVKILGISAQAFSRFDSPHLEGLSLNEFWQHSVDVGKIAQQIAITAGASQKYIDYAYTAGLLHDVGKLVLAVHYPQKYAAAIDLAVTKNIDLIEAECNIFNTVTHAQAGAYLLDLWGLPAPIVEALMFHHQPEKHTSSSFNCVTAVHAANVLEHQLYPDRTVGAAPQINHKYLVNMGLSDQYPVWQKNCTKATNEEP